MDTNVIFPRRLLKKFILLYKELPCLWDKRCPNYRHKERRRDAVSKLTALVQEFDPSATRVHILRKIESLRACIRREHKRVIDSRAVANNVDEIYVPQLWYYDLFSFVFNEYASATTIIPDARTTEHAAEPVEEEEEEGEEIGIEAPAYEQPNYSPDYNSMVEVADSPSMSKRFHFEEDPSKNKRHCTEIEDEYDAIGINVAAKLRGLPPNMRILAEKLINDVLFQAQVNGLNSSTVISTSDPFKQDI